MKYFLVCYADCSVDAYESMKELEAAVAERVADGDLDSDEVKDLDVFVGERYQLSAKVKADIEASPFVDGPLINDPIVEEEWHDPLSVRS